MLLIYKKFIFVAVLIFFSIQSWSQDSLQVKTDKISDNPVGSFSAGAYFANSVGSSFVKQGLDVKPGFALSLRAYVLPRLTVGAHYNFMRAEVSNPQITGNYDRTNIWVFGGTLGYEFKLFPKIDLLAIGGVGSAVYRNQKGSVRFTDRGLALWLTPEISYFLTESLAFYLSPEYRYDRMHIDVPQPLERSFKNISYVSLGAGIRFQL